MSEWITHPLQLRRRRGQNQDSHSHPPFFPLLSVQTSLQEEENRRLAAPGSTRGDWCLVVLEIRLGCSLAEESIRLVVAGSCLSLDRTTQEAHVLRCREAALDGRVTLAKIESYNRDYTGYTLLVLLLQPPHLLKD